MSNLCCSDLSNMTAWSCLKDSHFRQNKRKKDEECMLTSIIASLEPSKRRRGGSVPGHKFKRRDREPAFAQIMRDYFVDNPLYSEEDFRRWYATLCCCPF
jgi:hypothetical protein